MMCSSGWIDRTTRPLPLRWVTWDLRQALGLNSMAFPQIYKSILSYRRFPDGLFTGAAWRITALRTLMPAPSKSR